MGLSVSASAGIVLIGMLIILGTFYPAIEESERMENEARKDWTDWQNDKKKADLEIEYVKFIDNEDLLNITLNNTGDTVLEVSELEVLLDGVYSTGMILDFVISEDINNTNLWSPGQEMILTVRYLKEEIERVAIINGFGDSFYHSVKGA